MSDDTIYLGDGVYARFNDGFGVDLLANDANRPSDSIYLEDYVLAALVRLARQHGVLAPLPGDTEDAS